MRQVWGVLRKSGWPQAGLALCMAVGFLSAPLNSAQAGGLCPTEDCQEWWLTQDFNWTQKEYLLNTWYTNNIVNDLYGRLFVQDLLTQHVRPALMQMTGQLVAAQVEMTGAVGAMLDGQVANRTQLALQTLQAQSLSAYTPSEGLCRLGTGVRSLATSEEKSRQTAIALAEMGQARQLGTRGGSADLGPLMDRRARIKQFARLYCDPGDNNGDLKPVCQTFGNNGKETRSVPARFNKDINFARTLDGPRTLDLDFTDGALTADEEDLLALSANLYGHDVFSRLPAIMTSAAAGRGDNKPLFLNIRQLVGMRNVAQNSFNTLAAMRAKGGTGATAYLNSVLQEMGFSDAEAKHYMAGNAASPSYYAQMEILTKKLYQNPNFITHLMDKPANVDRQTAAMAAFGLMQDRDIYQSLQRQEMMMSLLLEMKVRREQAEVERKLKMLGMVK